MDNYNAKTKKKKNTTNKPTSLSRAPKEAHKINKKPHEKYKYI